MKQKVIEGTIRELTFKGKKSLYLDMPRKPEEAHLSFPLDAYYEPFLDKRVRMTIEEKKITIEIIED